VLLLSVPGIPQSALVDISVPAPNSITPNQANNNTAVQVLITVPKQYHNIPITPEYQGTIYPAVWVSTC
jgi:hypothetical protein